MVSASLVVGGVLAVLIGLAHSVLGERYILVRLFRRKDLPHLFGDDWFTKRTLRFAWHLTTVAWWGFGAILLVFAFGHAHSPRTLALWITGAVFFLSSVAAAGFTRAKHLSWVVFLAIALAAMYAAFVG